ncbi:MAG: triphosphoribosyl-dephospho-CoA synthase [Planctomycetaceae bacterium]|nr:triphosphoribosyl-dephospho-CoA synthase [Planctomycetaceae bacterium]
MAPENDWQKHLRDAIQAACVLEATARKPGNVHPDASFDDVRYEDFVRSAEAVAPILAESRQLGVGRAILEAVAATRQTVGQNTNLGIILLIAPLAAVPEGTSLDEGIERVLSGLTIEDARSCYEAISMANPGGLGAASEQDVGEQPTVTLREAMQMAADRDRVAQQYANGFQEVLRFGISTLLEHPWESDWEQAVIALHIQLMAEFPDTLILRKCGVQVAEESAWRAKRVLEAGWPFSDAGAVEIQRLDQWLRADGHRRNPGTTADLVAATLFAAFRDRRVLPGMPS